jgi:uncharacterized protein (TIGR02117 family)
VILIIIFTWAAFAYFLPFIKTARFNFPGEKTNAVYICSNGVHTDFVMPVKSQFIHWNNLLPYKDFENVDETFSYIGFGWGDKEFYINTPTWADLKFSTAFNAAFGLGSAAMHVTYWRNEPRPGKSCKRILFSDEQYKVLIHYIISSFEIGDSGFKLIDHPGYNDNDRFYEANGTYTLFKTCNVWTGTGLQVIGEKTGVWTPLSRSILQNIE